MPSTITSQLTLERTAAAVVTLGGAVSAAILTGTDTRTTGAPQWLLPAFAVIGAVVPLLIVLILRKHSHSATLAAFLPAAACHAAALGASGGGLLLKFSLGLPIAASLLICVRATVLRAEAAENQPRNRF